MSESWPLFQSALSSTPFSGTLADTSAQTPAGTLPQVPVANEAPGPSGDRARAEKLKSSEALDAAIQQHSELLKHLNDMVWSKHPNSDRWVRRQRLGLNGNKDNEPPEMMYQRFKAMDSVGKNLQALLEEKRLLNQPSPEERASQEEIARLTAKRIFEQGDIDALGRVWDKTAADHKERTGVDLPLESRVSFQYNPQGGIKSATGGVQSPEDLAKSIKAAQEIGQQATPEGITHLPPSMQGPAWDALRAKQKDEAAKIARAKADEATPVLGLFKTPGELHRTMLEDFKLNRNQEGFYHMEKYTTTDPFGLKKEAERRVYSKDEDKANRAAVVSAYPGYEKYFPNFVEKGFTDVPQVAPEQQQDIKTKLQIAREKLAATRAKTKAQ